MSKINIVCPHCQNTAFKLDPSKVPAFVGKSYNHAGYCWEWFLLVSVDLDTRVAITQKMAPRSIETVAFLLRKSPMAEVMIVSEELAVEWKAYRAAYPIKSRLRPVRTMKDFAIEKAVSIAQFRATQDGTPFDAVAARQTAESVVTEFGDGAFLDWLMNGGLEKIIELILKIIAAFT